MKQVKNEFIQHLLDFGEIVKINGKEIEESDHQKAYQYETNTHDYFFKTMNINETEFYSILVIRNLGIKDGKEFFAPLFALWFTEDGHIYLQNSDELAKTAGTELEVLKERYFGEW